MRVLSSMVLTLGLVFAHGVHAADHNTVVDFSSGTQGWEGHWDGLYSSIDTSMGNAAPAYRTQFSTFAITYANSTNSDFTGDFTQSKSVTFGLDINVMSMTQSDSEFGGPVDRDLVLELRDYDHAAPGVAYASVWIDLGKLTVGQGWQHLEATIADTRSANYAAGWSGNGAWDEQGNPMLPAGVSFTDILKGVDTMVFTTFVPGWSYTQIDFDVAIDNVSVSTVPEPSSLALQVAGLLAVGGFVRARRQERRVNRPCHPHDSQPAKG